MVYEQVSNEILLAESNEDYSISLDACHLAERVPAAGAKP
jgi:hypothetical protein